MKKIILLLIIICSLNIGCLRKNVDEIKCQYNFNLSIITYDISNYYLLFPLPVTENKTSLLLNEKISIKSGIGKIIIEDSEYGLVCNISGKGTISLGYFGNNKSDLNIYSEMPKIHISTIVDRDNDNYYYDETGLVEFWIFYKNEYNSTMHIDFIFEWGYTSYHSVTYNGNISSNWQKIKGYGQSISP